MTAAAWAIEFGFYVFVLYAESTPVFTANYIETAGARSSQFTHHRR